MSLCTSNSSASSMYWNTGSFDKLGVACHTYVPYSSGNCVRCASSHSGGLLD